ncbi:hypothetical protein CDL12_12438 [Handroanthus impetiginosus]|uniref:Uncharacterized protein n=1 Tax=Handroanthus impetiginosus TaxID=429701 RepID=A0A2G9HBP9_9LAMI|nr:hypothetical protein CDL12_12438 [Handroanthus impetiginosus]
MQKIRGFIILSSGWCVFVQKMRQISTWSEFLGAEAYKVLTLYKLSEFYASVCSWKFCPNFGEVIVCGESECSVSSFLSISFFQVFLEKKKRKTEKLLYYVY